MRVTNAAAAAVVAAAAVLTLPAAASAQQTPLQEVRTLDGSNNNLANPDWGRANTPYSRVAPANYADGIQAPVGGPAPRRVSNRVFSDVAQNVFSENGVTQWGFTWGQFMDHTFGLRREAGGEFRPLAFDSGDPLEEFIDTVGGIPFNRTPAAPGTGVGTTPREQINTVSSYIDAFSVYGGTETRLEWLREGPVDGNLSNNGARLLLAGDGLLPRRDARSDAASAPAMEAPGRLAAMPGRAMVAGDVRANENIGLTATHALFAREHNRIVGQLPSTLSEEQKFQIARRVVGAEQQFITYTEFLPSLGVTLAPYRGYNPSVNAGLSNEFAVVGYRAHSMIHGELEPSAPEGTYTPAQLAAFEAQGIGVEHEEGEVVLVIPLVLAFGNPDLLASAGLAPVLKGLGGEPQYKNDEQIDNQLRSVLFELPIPGNLGCLDGPTMPECFRGVVDLGAIDIERGRDHGLPRYNPLRQAYGLRPKASFKQVTGEPTDRFQNDPEIDRNNPINDRDILDFVELRNADGDVIPLDSEEAESDAVAAVRRTSVAARLRAMYGDNPSQADAFVGMVAEPHVPEMEFGELQLAIWRRQFEALRDGDRFFYLNDAALGEIERRYGVTYRHTLGEIIELNTAIDVEDNVFEVAPE